MHIPYMKVGIYALTFLTYAYTGYGSNMISSLRDAIVAAETVFGDFFKNAIYLAKKFRVVHEVFDKAVEEHCVYSCPGGTTPTKHKFYVPSSDGCGSLGMKIDTSYLPAAEMEKCCDAHDICYDSCNSDKELCDLDFKRCLYRYCDGYEKTVVGEMVVKGCKAAAKMLFTGTLTLGCKSYLDGQQKSCYCPPEKASSSSTFDKTDRTEYAKKPNYKEKKPSNYGWRDSKEL
uniref:Putative group xii secretory phospholipase a2 n=1 Tax=Corethrella appendiculata TaxID=1370023 RepID=U5EF81_9DIPT